MASIISAGTTSGTSLNLSGDTSGVLQLASNGSTTAVTIDTNQRAAFVAGTAALPAITTTGDTNTGIFFPAADTIAFTEGGAESMRIDSSGNVGIGTVSPAYKLDVVNTAVDGGIQITGGASGANLFLNNNGTGGRKYRVYSTGSSNAVGAGFLGFFDETAGQFRMGIDSLGSLLVNATSNGYGVTGGIYAPSVYDFTTASAANMFIESGGFFRRSTSSIKYKTNVENATHGLADVMKLRPVTYKGVNDGETVFGGLIAEEVHDAGLTEFVQYADDGSPDALAYGNMVSLCVKAIQELKAELDATKAEVQALKGVA